MNYMNLSDIEFEYLCQDIMSKKLSLTLERFGKGRDGGVDLRNYKKGVVIQVKHYVNTGAAGLINSLKKEVPKIEKLSPKQYFICCSKTLTPQNKEEIFHLFSSYMDSPSNIITALELDEFLEAPKNIDILRKHFKLWIESTNILSDFLHNDIFIDSETLLSNINEEVKLFVKTRAFDDAIACLEKKNTLIIIGNPGVGKTITSKMLVLYYANLGYRVRYTTDGTDLSALKNALSQSPDSKEVILLDDCFGQAYFNIKETQENELLSLIRYVNLNNSKMLIMNSRVSIYNEAKDRNPKLVNSFDRKEYGTYILDLDQLSVKEKAKILYNHLYFYGIPKEHFNSIKENKQYRVIVKHNNYNPRIIEFACMPRQFKQILPNEFADFIINSLNNPEQIWKNEYERRLSETDRLLLTTLFSLSDTTIPYEMLKQCFEYRISTKSDIDLTINSFSQSLNRLTDSMVSIIDSKGEKMVKAANPSVNDFLRTYLHNNQPERQSLIDGSHSVRQLKRLMDSDPYDAVITKKVLDHSILTLVFENENQKQGFITAWCAKKQICDNAYRSIVTNYLFFACSVYMYESERLEASYILKNLLNKKLIEFYGFDKHICDYYDLQKILKKPTLEETVTIIQCVDWLYKGTERKLYIQTIQDILEEKIDDFCCDIPAEMYDIIISEIIDNNTYYDDEDVGHIDGDAAVNQLEDRIKDYVMDDLLSILNGLPEDINPNNYLYSNASVSISGANSLISQYLRDDYDDEYRALYYEDVDDKEIDYMFSGNSAFGV